MHLESEGLISDENGERRPKTENTESLSRETGWSDRTGSDETAEGNVSVKVYLFVKN